MTPDFRRLFESLLDEQVDFVVVGGVALVLHGSARTTQDLDICYDRDSANLTRLATALAPFEPSLRGAPPGLPFRLDADTLRSGLNFTLTTAAGDLDILGDLSGVGGYADLAPGAEIMQLYGRPVRVMDLASLETAKRAAGRLKDLAALEEIKEIRRQRGR